MYITLIGSIGAGIILIAFILNQIKKINRDDFVYDFLNFVGSLFLVVYAYLLSSYPFLILNLIWLFVSLKDLFISNYASKK